MFDFLYTEAFWMETIISALISALAGLLTVVITFNYKLKCIKDSVEKSKELLDEVKSNKLTELSKEIVDSINKISDFSDKFQDVNSENIKLKEKIQQLEITIEELQREKELEDDELEMEF